MNLRDALTRTPDEPSKSVKRVQVAYKPTQTDDAPLSFKLPVEVIENRAKVGEILKAERDQKPSA